MYFCACPVFTFVTVRYLLLCLAGIYLCDCPVSASEEATLNKMVTLLVDYRNLETINMRSIRNMKNKKRDLLILTITLFTTSLLPAQKKLLADPSSTTVEWRGDKIIGSAHTGTISISEGWLLREGTTIAGGEFVVDMGSIINTDIKDAKMREKLEAHLRSDDFFGVERYPLSRLVITGSSPAGAGRSLVKGLLTIKEDTHPVEFTATESAGGNEITYLAEITFDRSLYNVRFGSGRFFSNLGDNAINDMIKLNVKLVVK